MSDELVFMMGQFAVRFPCERSYSKNHMWAKSTGGAYRFGFAAYAVRLLQDVYFLDWTVDVGTQLKNRQEIGSVESSKAESDLYSPMAGTLKSINEGLLSDPSTINVDPYGKGWLLEIEGDAHEMLSPAEYMEHLKEAWKVAERTIKGQLN